MPFSIYCSLRLRRALGALPVSDVVPPPRSRPAASSADPGRRLGQFRGNVAAVTWNAQAFFAAAPGRHEVKQGHLHSLLRRADVVMITEAHGTKGLHDAWRPPLDTQAWWSAGATTAHAGVGLVIKNAFLRQFDPRPVWKVILPGRAAMLKLRGPSGALDLVVTYFPTGDQPAGDDLYGFSAAECEHASAFHELRGCLRSRLSRALSPRASALTLLGGDFNYVTDEFDRVSTTTAASTGRRDAHEERHFQSVLGTPFGLVELYQPAPTHASASARSRLDRMYMNHDMSDQLDRHFKAVALEWRPDLSAHRPVLASRSLPQRLPADARRVSDFAVNHPDFQRRVTLAYQEKLRTASGSSGLGRLWNFKQAVREVAAGLAADQSALPPAESQEDRLGTTMKLIRAVECGLPGEVSKCLVRYPRLRELIGNPYDFAGNLSIRLRELRQHAVELARDHALDELAAASADGQGELQEEEGHRARRTRQRGARLIHRLAPGRSAGIAAVADARGEVQTCAPAMAAALRSHWRGVFAARGHDAGLLGSWIAEEQASRTEENRLLALPAGLRLRRRHIRRAIKLTGNTSPGPDGIPFRVWRLFGDLAVELLWDAFNGLIAEDAIAELDELGFAFNASLLHLLPKKAVGTAADGTPVYSAAATRPLNVVNTDNRVIASAVRLMLERVLAPRITRDQRGFLQGRSMLANVVDVEETMCECTLAARGSLAFFMDFEAAFPSVEHGFLLDLFRAAGWPPWLLRFLGALYHGNSCQISLSGMLFEGFVATRGVRQGCPLSPLLLAASSDLLLERIGRCCGAFRRAYADDTAVILRDGLPSVGALARVFDEFAKISGMRLNFSKTVVVPLFVVDSEALRADLATVAPAWGQMCIADHARYLGFEVGPGRGELSWSAPLRKYRERVDIWRSIGAGLRLTIAAYRVYVLSVLLFVAQLERVPNSALEAENRALLQLAPGPSGWITPDSLRLLREYGMVNEFASLSACATAAAARTHRFEDIQGGGLRVGQRLRGLQDRLRDADGVDLRHLTWIRGCALFTLAAATDEIGRVGPAGGWGLPGGVGDHAVDATARRQLQRRMVQALRPDGALALAHARRRLDRWTIPLLPGHRVARMQAVGATIASEGPPRLVAAFIRTAFNGWCTARRFQGRGGCALACRGGQDSIEHYSVCPAFSTFCARHVGLATPTPERRLECFLNLGRSFLVRGEVDTPGRGTLARALANYALYRVHNLVRTGAVRPSDAVDALPCMLREGARGHNGAQALLGLLRRRPRAA